MFNVDKSIFKEMGTWSRLLFLLLFLIGGLFIASFLIVLVDVTFKVLEISISYIYILKIRQTIAAICIFLLPALFYAKLFFGKPIQYLCLNRYPGYKVVLLTVVSVILLQPMIQLISYYSHQIVLPDALQWFEEWALVKEEEATNIQELFIADKSFLSYLTNIFVVAILAGLVEETFFRGCLQQILEKGWIKKHCAVWVTAIIFSAIHMQFYSFAPIMVAGVLLGYLFVWSDNLWLPILAHAFHNAINLLLAQIYYGSDKYGALEYMNIENHKWIGGVSLFYLLFIILYLKKKQVTFVTNAF